MTKFMDWLANSFAPAMQKLTKRPWVAAVSGAMQKLIPFILTGSLVFFYNVFRSYLAVLPDLGKLADYTFGMIGLITAFMVTNQAMEKLRHPGYAVSASLVSICVFLMYIKPVFADGNMTVEFGRLGPTGILVGMISGLLVAIVFHNYSKLNVLKNSEVPDFVVEWINNIIPISIAVGLSALITFKFDLDMFDLIVKLFSLLQSFGQTLPGFILVCFIPSFFYSMGISSWLFGPVTTPIFMAGISANIAAVEAGQAATYIVTSETVFTAALITMGGMGATLGLNVLMLWSKSPRLKTIGRICIGPSIFNINEPIMFSGPVVMNPMLMLPMWVNSIIGPIVVWIAMRTDLLKIPSKMIQVGQIPAPFSSVMITEDWRALIVYALLFVIYLFIWLPFFKVYEKQVLAEEK
ncbi:PTS sugar transporter subunit IIC [Vagococcus sp. BWB3-3]|uniref:Permease IIC component n=1 Tax=Vagococcus allomyrinae TaxID=2794353 RepID=A0A940PFG9_9ENTE|nr:PTS transporter subunit EIIC [Vagococcus allomyrinae]MBP1042576.1 PTS sugar transporter subunit IIC [Vagococcus allomyrinae]